MTTWIWVWGRNGFEGRTHAAGEGFNPSFGIGIGRRQVEEFQAKIYVPDSARHTITAKQFVSGSSFSQTMQESVEKSFQLNAMTAEPYLVDDP
ncbi:MAG: hypothetical protein ABJH45_01725 [Paracoccaceae bacterium]